MALTPLLLLAAACGSAQGAAENAIGAAEAAIAGIEADASKVAPTRLAELQAALGTARQALEAGDYAAASENAAGLPGMVEELSAALPALRTELTEAWAALSEAMPRNIEAVSTKLGELDKMRRLPAGLDEAAVGAARDAIALAPGAWAEAKAAFDGGDLAGGMTRANALRESVSQAMAAVGLVSDESAWGNARVITP